jgi:DNA-binding NarL/FixJ family response regulator
MQTTTILLLEDEALIAMDVEQTLADSRVGEATASCAGAIKRLESDTPDVVAASESHRVFLKGIWIWKPSDPRDLVAAVKLSLQGSRVAAAAVDALINLRTQASIKGFFSN